MCRRAAGQRQSVFSAAAAAYYAGAAYAAAAAAAAAAVVRVRGGTGGADQIFLPIWRPSVDDCWGGGPSRPFHDDSQSTAGRPRLCSCA